MSPERSSFFFGWKPWPNRIVCMWFWIVEFYSGNSWCGVLEKSQLAQDEISAWEQTASWRFRCCAGHCALISKRWLGWKNSTSEDIVVVPMCFPNKLKWQPKNSPLSHHLFLVLYFASAIYERVIWLHKEVKRVKEIRFYFYRILFAYHIQPSSIRATAGICDIHVWFINSCFAQEGASMEEMPQLQIAHVWIKLERESELQVPGSHIIPKSVVTDRSRGSHEQSLRATRLKSLQHHTASRFEIGQMYIQYSY